MDHIDAAITATVHDSAIGAKEIAKRIGVSHQTLLNKANPQSEFHKLTLREAVAIQLATGTHRIHEAMGLELGVHSFSSPLEGTAPSVLEAVLHTAREHGDVMRTIDESLADGRFTPRQRENCQREIDEAIHALCSLRVAIVNHK